MESSVDPIVSMVIGREIIREDIKFYIKEKLSTNKKWAIAALLKIFEKQTLIEKEYGTTYASNGVGFNATDTKILSSIAEQYTIKGFLTPKQLQLIHKKLPKYWLQILNISNQEKLKLQIRLSFHR